jgi:hypothetical protein
MLRSTVTVDDSIGVARPQSASALPNGQLLRSISSVVFLHFARIVIDADPYVTGRRRQRISARQ